MRFTPLSLLGLGFFLLAFFGGVRVRRELATGEARWWSSLFRDSLPIRREASPLRYWTAVTINTLVVLLFALACALMLRVGSLRLLR